MIQQKKIVRDGVLTVIQRLREPCVSGFFSRLGGARVGDGTRHFFRYGEQTRSVESYNIWSRMWYFENSKRV
jgi:hypothetical protein